MSEGPRVGPTWGRISVGAGMSKLDGSEGVQGPVSPVADDSEVVLMCFRGFEIVPEVHIRSEDERIPSPAGRSVKSPSIPGPSNGEPVVGRRRLLCSTHLRVPKACVRVCSRGSGHVGEGGMGAWGSAGTLHSPLVTRNSPLFQFIRGSSGKLASTAYSPPIRRKTARQRESGSVLKTRSVALGAVIQASSSSSASNWPGPHPA